MKTITITLYKSEIIYDVKNKTFLTGKSRENGNNYEQVANMQANDEDDNENQLLRSIGNAFDTLKAKLSSYVSGTGTTASNILLTAEGNLEISLEMPDNFNQGVIDSVKSAIDKYIVNSVLFDWFTITKPDEAQTYFELAKNNVEELRESLNKRIRPTRTAPVA